MIYLFKQLYCYIFISTNNKGMKKNIILASEIKAGNTLDGLTVTEVRQTKSCVFVTVDLISFKEVIKYNLNRLVQVG